MSIYQFQARLASGKEYSLEKYQGKALMIVNTASKCGLRGQFKELEALYQKYKDDGFVVLGFPSNQFHQELTDAQQAKESCQLNYGVTFPIHELIAVNGPDADPLFMYLKEQQPGVLTKDIKWNFTKFLVDKTGTVVNRYGPKTSPLEATPMIEKLLHD